LSSAKHSTLIELVNSMGDLVFVAVTLVFFTATAGFIVALDRI
jgi:hypothetical protein